MKLSFKQPYLSISGFPDIELPPFAVVIGINGSGKSHFLQAIANGCISNTIVEKEPFSNNLKTQSIKLISQGETPPTLELIYNKSEYDFSPNNPINLFEDLRTTLLAEHRTALEREAKCSLLSVLKPNEDIWRLGDAEVVRRLAAADPQNVKKIFIAAEEALTTLNTGHPFFTRTHPKIDVINLQENIKIVAEKLGTSPLSLTQLQLKLFSNWAIVDKFSMNIGILFGKYRDALLQNRLLKLQDENCNTNNAMSEAEFIANFGRPPWDEINEVIKNFSLPYEFLCPELFNFDPFTVIMRKTGSTINLSPYSLSSGEKVLLQFALSYLQYDEYLISVLRPSLILLDEMDASLHPEMVNRWLGAVNNGLVKAQGIHCILTTHSPTTVALTPEEALFEMTDGHSGLRKVTKQEALNRLTFGVPTLSINYTGRRQVFAESDTDAAIYESIYSIIKSHIQCDRELNFLSTGIRKKDKVEINTGGTIVKQIVDNLAELGNSSIFGIIDWDGEAVSTDRIKVVAEGERNGIENVLLDPLLVALLLMKERRLPDGLTDIDRFSGVQGLAPDNLQRLIDAIQLPVFPSATEHVEVAYLGGAKGKVTRAYLEADDHDLEDALADKFPALNKWKKKGRGELVKAVIEHVLSEHVSFCPVALPIVFKAIANVSN